MIREGQTSEGQARQTWLAEVCNMSPFHKLSCDCCTSVFCDQNVRFLFLSLVSHSLVSQVAAFLARWLTDTKPRRVWDTHNARARPCDSREEIEKPLWKFVANKPEAQWDKFSCALPPLQEGWVPLLLFGETKHSCPLNFFENFQIMNGAKQKMHQQPLRNQKGIFKVHYLTDPQRSPCLRGRTLKRFDRFKSG